MRKKILEAIRDAVHVPADAITEETKVEDIVMDSMDTVEVFAVLSTEFQVPIEPSRMGHICTVGDLVDYTIDNQGKAKGKRPLTIF